MILYYALPLVMMFVAAFVSALLWPESFLYWVSEFWLVGLIGIFSVVCAYIGGL